MKELGKKYNLFGDKIEIIIYVEEDFLGEEILEETYKEALRLQKIFNFYDSESELSVLNKQRELISSEELMHVIKKAIKYSELTNGKYDVTKGKEFLQRKKGLQEKKSNCSYKDIQISKNKITLLNENVEIDLGSIAKGYITDKIAQKLKTSGIENGFVDSRGDVITFGEIGEIISIQHPRNQEKNITQIEAKNKAIATSGDYNQYNKNYKSSHIIGTQQTISATVITEKLEDADAIATCLMVLNKQEQQEFLKKIKCSTIIINQEKNKLEKILTKDLDLEVTI